MFLASLRTLVGRVWLDIDRKLDLQNEIQAAKATSILERVKQLLEHKPKDRNKLYSLHAPEVECISKGKIRKPYEFVVKVTVATTHKRSDGSAWAAYPVIAMRATCYPKPLSR